MTGIDQVSNLLGKLEQAAADAEKHRQEMDNKLDQVLILVPTVTRLAETIATQEEMIKKNAEKINNLRLFKAQIIGVAAGVSAVITIIGGFSMKFLFVMVK